MWYRLAQQLQLPGLDVEKSAPKEKIPEPKEKAQYRGKQHHTSNPCMPVFLNAASRNFLAEKKNEKWAMENALQVSPLFF